MLFQIALSQPAVQRITEQETRNAIVRDQERHWTNSLLCYCGSIEGLRKAKGFSVHESTRKDYAGDGIMPRTSTTQHGTCCLHLRSPPTPVFS